MRAIAGCVALAFGAVVHAASPPADCAAGLDARWPGWQRATVEGAAAEWVKQRRIDPAVARGDFDGDGRRDAAVLFDHGGQRWLVVCMRRAPRLRVLEANAGDRHCSQLVYTSKAGGAHHNYETDRDEKLRHDGISVSCFEKAGWTYVFERGSFRRIHDVD